MQWHASIADFTEIVQQHDYNDSKLVYKAEEMCVIK